MRSPSIGGLAAALAFGLSASAVSAEEVTIRYSKWLPTGFHMYDNVIEPWFGEIERVTEGRVKVEILPKTVGSVVGQYDVVAEGLADMAYISLGYTPGRFVPMEFGTLSGAPGKPENLGKAFYRVYQEHIKDELDVFPGVVPLSTHLLTPFHPTTNGAKIEKPADMKGLKMRTSSASLTAAFELLGVVPIHKSATEASEMIAAGTIDGQATLPSTVLSFNGLDLHDHLFIMRGGLANTAQIIGINEDKWNEISPADQAAILSVSGEVLAVGFSESNATEDLKAIEVFEEHGYTVTYATPEVQEEFGRILAPITEDWFARAKEAGLENPEEVLQAYHDELRKIEGE